MMGRRAAWAVVAAVVGSLSPAAAAHAKLPSPATKRIVPGKSIGGVRLGMSLAAAQATWGPGGVSEADDACDPDSRTSCIWAGRSAREYAVLRFDEADGTVDFIRIVGPRTSPLARWRTSKGWGIGTRSSTLLRASRGRLPFPAGLGAPAGTGSVFVFGRTDYFINRRNGHVHGVEVS
jgi:hypothetical protein